MSACPYDKVCSIIPHRNGCLFTCDSCEHSMRDTNKSCEYLHSKSNPEGCKFYCDINDVKNSHYKRKEP